jgi:hypothetical protein
MSRLLGVVRNCTTTMPKVSELGVPSLQIYSKKAIIDLCAYIFSSHEPVKLGIVDIHILR